MYPHIDSPCPLKSLQLPATGNFNCANCRREVQDLSALTELQRRAFLASCEGEVCVSYKIPHSLKSLKQAALAGVFVVAANGLAVSAAAFEFSQPSADGLYEEIVVGGIDNPKTRALEKNSTQEEAPLELIPTVLEE